MDKFEDGRSGSAVTCSGICTKEQHETYDTGTVVEKGFCIDQGRETLAGFQFMQQGNYGYRVGSTDQGTEHQGKGPGPGTESGNNMADCHQQCSGEQHTDDESGYGQ